MTTPHIDINKAILTTDRQLMSKARALGQMQTEPAIQAVDFMVA